MAAFITSRQRTHLSREKTVGRTWHLPAVQAPLIVALRYTIMLVFLPQASEGACPLRPNRRNRREYVFQEPRTTCPPDTCDPSKCWSVPFVSAVFLSSVLFSQPPASVPLSSLQCSPTSRLSLYHFVHILRSMPYVKGALKKNASYKHVRTHTNV